VNRERPLGRMFGLHANPKNGEQPDLRFRYQHQSCKLPGLKWLMDYLPEVSDLRAATDKSRVEFLQTDLGLCITFADLAITELGIGDREAAQRVLQKAEIAYATIARIVQEVENADQKDEIVQRLVKLRARLDSIHAVLHKD
jgi:hypothetical protein